MTNKISKEFLFTELSIKIAILEAKLDKLLDLAMKQQYQSPTEDFDDENPTNWGEN